MGRPVYGREKDKEWLVKVANILYSRWIKSYNSNQLVTKNSVGSDSIWMPFLEKYSEVLSIDTFDTDEISFYNMLLVSNISNLRRNKLTTENIIIPKLQEVKVVVSVNVLKRCEVLYGFNTTAYSEDHADSLMEFQFNEGLEAPFEGDELGEEDCDIEDFTWKIIPQDVRK